MKEKLIIQHYFKTLFIQQSMMKMGVGENPTDQLLILIHLWESKVKQHLFANEEDGGKLVHMMKYYVEEMYDDGDFNLNDSAPTSDHIK